MARVAAGLLCYLLIATGISFLGREFIGLDFSFLEKLLLVVLFVASGPTIAAFISWRLWPKLRGLSSLFGCWPKWAAILAAVIPVAVLAFSGYPNELGIQANLMGAIVALCFLFYALGEEIGWRGFVHDALAPNPIFLRGLITGIVWWLWHLWFLQGEFELIKQMQGLALLLAIAVLFAYLVSESQSWLMMAAFHSVGNIGMMAPIIDLPSDERIKLAAIMLVLLIAVHSYCKKKFLPGSV